MHLKAAREKEAEKDPLSNFNQEMLRERLVLSVPLQKLYEKVFFDFFDLKEACRKHDNFEDETVTQMDFEKVVL